MQSDTHILGETQHGAYWGKVRLGVLEHRLLL